MPAPLVTASTLTHEDESAKTINRNVLALRWIFPLPSAEPTWLTAARTTFGRDAACTVRLDGDFVSRQHAAVTRSGPLWILTDLDSKNGLSVGGIAVRDAVLVPGDVVRIGSFVAVATLAPPESNLASSTLGPGIHGGLALRQAWARMKDVAQTDLSVLLEGETGTGKETFARALHEASGRKGPFRGVNCAVYSKAIAAAELFGYRKGAFTGADTASVGHLRAADGGTLLLDELTELPLDVQSMLLRALENREVLPLGESRPVPINVRFVAATQVPLNVAVERGIFRADLRARLEGSVIALPPLRQAREVVLETFLDMFERHAGERPPVRAAFAEGLSLHDWPLNLRELDTVARRIASGHRPPRELDGTALETAFGAERAKPLLSDRPAPRPNRESRGQPYKPAELDALSAALDRADGNLTEAASAIGVSRSKAYRMLTFARGRARSSSAAPRSK